MKYISKRYYTEGRLQLLSANIVVTLSLKMERRIFLFLMDVRSSADVVLKKRELTSIAFMSTDVRVWELVFSTKRFNEVP
jgi:hypothetical protein